MELKENDTDLQIRYLIHSPFFGDQKTSLQAAWASMERIKASGKAKSIGVSNFLQPHLEIILETATIPPAINQIEYNPYLQHGDLISFHKKHNIAVSAYAALNPVTRAKDGPLNGYLSELAEKYGVSESEILIQWVVGQGVVAITTSGKEERLTNYLKALEFSLTEEETKKIAEIGDTYHFRCCFTRVYAPDDRS